MVKLHKKADLAKAEKYGVLYEATLKNDSKQAVTEILQAYMRREHTDNEVLNHRLCAFKRMSLKAGETRTVNLKLPKEAFRVINADGEAVPEGSQAKISIGFGQPDRRTKKLMHGKYILEDMIK